MISASKAVLIGYLGLLLGLQIYQSSLGDQKWLALLGALVSNGVMYVLIWWTWQ